MNNNYAKLNDERKALYRAVFNTPNGKQVLEDLAAQLNPDSLFVHGDTNATHVNLGKREAYIYIEQLLRGDENE